MDGLELYEGQDFQQKKIKEMRDHNFGILTYMGI